MPRREAILGSVWIGLLAGAACGLVLSLLFNPRLLVAYLFSALAYGLAGGLLALAGTALLALWMVPRRALQITGTLITAFFLFVTLAYWGNKWLLVSTAFWSRESLLFDGGALVASLAVGALVTWIVARGLAGRRGRARPLVLATIGLVVLLPAVLLLVFAARGRAPLPAELAGQPNIILISIDTMRADHLGCYGYARDTSPVFDQLAADGLRFETVFCPVPSTTPSHATMLTGLSPQTHGARANAFAVPDSITTLAERLVAAGYATGGFTSCVLLDDRFRFSQGYETYIESGHVERLEPLEFDLLIQTLVVKEIADKLRGRYAGGSDPTILSAKKWLAHNRERPFFLFLHLLDPHTPYEPLEPYRSMFPRETAGLENTLWAQQGRSLAALARNIALYDGEIAAADAKIGELLDYLDASGLRDRTLVVLTSDHGENLKNHEPFFGHWDIYESSLRVPLILRFPGVLRSGRVVPGIVENSSIVPTILSLAGQPVPDVFDGDDLAALIDGTAEIADRFAVAAAGRYALRMEDWKVAVDFRAGQVELYDLVSDPAERRDVLALRTEQSEAYARYEDRAREMERILRTELERREGFIRQDPDAPLPIEQLDRRTIESLKALGYID